MKVYLDQSIIEEWLKYRSMNISLKRYIMKTKKTREISDNLESFSEIINMPNLRFLYSNLNVEECPENRMGLFNKLVSSHNFQKVPSVGLRGCMVGKGLPSDNILEIGDVQAYYASNINKFGNRKNKNIQKYMRRKFFDDMHVDSAIRAGADVFLTIDFNLLRRIENHPKFHSRSKIRILPPFEFKKFQ